MTTNDDDRNSVDQLIAGRRDLNLPFALQLQHPEPLDVSASLRLLPGKRLSARACWGGRPVMAKIFVRARRGDAHAAAEQHGHRRVNQAGIATPELLWQGLSRCGRLCVVLYDFLDGAQSCGDIYRHDVARRDGIVAAMISMTAKLHAVSAWQDDPHLDNFLWVDTKAWLVDVGSVVTRPRALSDIERQRNLALLLSQLPLTAHEECRQWCEQYNIASGAAALDANTLAPAISRAWRIRGEEVLSKAMRDCSATRIERSWRRFMASRRVQHDDEMSKLLANIDGALATGKVLKNGNSATVVLVERGARRWVVKRYNLKSVWHRLRRCLRESRAVQSWRNAHLLEFAGIATPAPVAVVEERFGPLRGRAWFVSEFTQGTEMLAAYQQREPLQQEMEQTLSIFRLMQLARISHGDLKAQNLMIGDDGVVRLIDLDAMQWHESVSTWERYFVIDMKRFLRNWQGAKRQRFATMLKSLLPGFTDG